MSRLAYQYGEAPFSPAVSAHAAARYYTSPIALTYATYSFADYAITLFIMTITDGSYDAAAPAFAMTAEEIRAADELSLRY